MKRTLVLAASVLAGAVLVAATLVSLSVQLRGLSGELAALTREVNLIGADVQSLADDVATLADTLAGEEEAAPDEPCPSDASTIRPRAPRRFAPKVGVPFAVSTALRGRATSLP